MRTIQVAAILLLAAGLGLCSFALLLYAGAALPYQDAPPELLIQQANEMQNARNLFWAGSVVIAAGVACLWKWLQEARAVRPERDAPVPGSHESEGALR